MPDPETKALRVDELYRNTNNWKHPDDVFNRYFRFNGVGIKNVGGFRAKSKATGSKDICESAFVALITNFSEPAWPDSLDRETGAFIYYGDNREPGPIHDTPVGGNRLLERVFRYTHINRRHSVPPLLAFQSVSGADGMAMRFLGLVCPGGPGLSPLDDLVAVWSLHGEHRFQNYRSSFTVLSEETVPRTWLEDLVAGIAPADSPHCPPTWKHWVQTGSYLPLTCERQKKPRSREDQEPGNERERDILSYIVANLDGREFEFFARDLILLMDRRFTNLRVTRSSSDGGRDVLADYRVGHDDHQVLLEAVVEAKRWEAGGIGVKPMMRLLSRLKHRDIGVFITTSFFQRQVQEELIEDRHPVILVSGGDIARLLVANDVTDYSPGGKLDAAVRAARTAAKL